MQEIAAQSSYSDARMIAVLAALRIASEKIRLDKIIERAQQKEASLLGSVNEELA